MSECAICGGAGPSEAVYGRDKNGSRYVRNQVHPECKQRKAEDAARRRTARMAKKWEEAGQTTFEHLSSSAGLGEERR